MKLAHLVFLFADKNFEYIQYYYSDPDVFRRVNTFGNITWYKINSETNFKTFGTSEINTLIPDHINLEYHREMLIKHDNYDALQNSDSFLKKFMLLWAFNTLPKELLILISQDLITISSEIKQPIINKSKIISLVPNLDFSDWRYVETHTYTSKFEGLVLDSLPCTCYQYNYDYNYDYNEKVLWYITYNGKMFIAGIVLSQILQIQYRKLGGKIFEIPEFLYTESPENFAFVADKLLNHYGICSHKRIFRIVECEFYLYSPNHQDPHIDYKHLIHPAGKFITFRKKIGLTFGRKYYGVILLKVKKDRITIKNINDLILKPLQIPRDDIIYNTKRKELKPKDKQFADALYRYCIY